MSEGKAKLTPLTATGMYSVHPKRQNISYGRWAIPVMARKMEDPDPLERRRAVQSMCDYVFDSRRVSSKEFSSNAAGRQAFHKHGFYEEALKLIDDSDAAVRNAANIVLQRISISPIGAESLVKSGAVPKLVERIPKEPDHILHVLLQTLHACCLVDASKCLDFNAVEAVVPLLESADVTVLEKAATVIKDLTVEAEGRTRVLETKALTPLLDLCASENETVQAKALAAVMMIANETPAKFMAIEKKCIEKILPLTIKSNMEIRLNSIKVLTALAEAPPGRMALLGKYQKIVALLNDKVPEVKRAAVKLVSVVDFVP
ncbi:uncharacterized protein LOC129224840 [Uloborus diversus]|uniref:uncharacterized protein LOC129224840 n=1 Tax=Uloborus diversus TaxID=327109 RepID=UPI0024098256|nr:uncharacterized protein LOC129224840 [Uloborus diversus]